MKKQVNDNWLVVKLKPNKANIAMKNLDRQNFVFFYPKFSSTVKKHSQFKNVMKPLFFNYIFVSLDEGNRFFYKINNTVGVSHIIKFGNEIPVISGEEIRKLRNSLNQSKEKLSSNTFEVGQEIRIKNGPFANLTGKIENLSNDSRVWILLKWLDKQMRVSVNKFNLVKQLPTN